jgi:long-chain acyl-CoA synthetase
MAGLSEIFERDFTYLSAFMRNVVRYPNRCALTCTTREESWTYGELNAECNKLAHAFLDRGLGPNDVVMACLFNTAEFVFCWIGAQKAGVVFSPINFRLAEGEIAAHIGDSWPKLFLYDADLKDVIHKAVRCSEHPPETMVMVGEGEPFPGSIHYAEFVAGTPQAMSMPRARAPSTRSSDYTPPGPPASQRGCR